MAGIPLQLTWFYGIWRFNPALSQIVLESFMLQNQCTAIATLALDTKAPTAVLIYSSANCAKRSTNLRRFQSAFDLRCYYNYHDAMGCLGSTHAPPPLATVDSAFLCKSLQVFNLCSYNDTPLSCLCKLFLLSENFNFSCSLVCLITLVADTHKKRLKM